VPVPTSTLFPQDKGTALVLVLTAVSVVLLAATGRGRPALPRGAVLAAGLTAGLLGVFVASAPGIAGETGIPAASVALVAAALAVATLDRRAETLLAFALVVVAALLVAVAPADTSGFLSGDPPHAGERAFLVVGSVLLGASCLAAGALGHRRGAPLATAGAAAVLVAGALAHGYALLGPLV